MQNILRKTACNIAPVISGYNQLQIAIGYLAGKCRKANVGWPKPGSSC
jgi:hypothetical protein